MRGAGQTWSSSAIRSSASVSSSSSIVTTDSNHCLASSVRPASSEGGGVGVPEADRPRRDVGAVEVRALQGDDGRLRLATVAAGAGGDDRHLDPLGRRQPLDVGVGGEGDRALGATEAALAVGHHRQVGRVAGHPADHPQLGQRGRRSPRCGTPRPRPPPARRPAAARGRGRTGCGPQAACGSSSISRPAAIRCRPIFSARSCGRLRKPGLHAAVELAQVDVVGQRWLDEPRPPRPIVGFARAARRFEPLAWRVVRARPRGAGRVDGDGAAGAREFLSSRHRQVSQLVGRQRRMATHCWVAIRERCPAASYSPTPSPGQYHRR